MGNGQKMRILPAIALVIFVYISESESRSVGDNCGTCPCTSECRADQKCSNHPEAKCWVNSCTCKKEWHYPDTWEVVDSCERDEHMKEFEHEHERVIEAAEKSYKQHHHIA